MSKTAREAISKFLLTFRSDQNQIEQGYRDLVNVLGDAGFVILPKKPTAKMIEAVTLWDYANGEGATGDDVAEIYGEMVSAALKEQAASLLLRVDEPREISSAFGGTADMGTCCWAF